MEKINKGFKNLSPHAKLDTRASKDHVRDWARRRQLSSNMATKTVEELGKEATIAQAKTEILKRIRLEEEKEKSAG